MEEILKTIQEIKVSLSPLRFLLSNFEHQGQGEFDSYDLQCLGDILDKNLRLMEEVYVALEKFDKKFRK